MVAIPLVLTDNVAVIEGRRLATFFLYSITAVEF